VTIFKQGAFTLHSGSTSNFKIDLDDLTDEDWATLAEIALYRRRFRSVVGVPRGGLKFAAALEKYAEPMSGYPLPTLIVDDVLTTGNSMEAVRAKLADQSNVFGVVVFARGECPGWVHPIFRMTLTTA
jgi:orotate phosphoribosyltransferase